MNTEFSFDLENPPTSSQEIIVSQITEYFQGKIAKDINDMAGHIVNTLNTTKEDTLAEKDFELEKYKCIIKIQQSLIQVTNFLNTKK